MRSAIVAFFLFALLTGCGGKSKDDPEAKHKDPNKEKAPPGGWKDKSGKDGEVRGDEPPKGFPSELPYYPGSKVVNVLSIPGAKAAVTLSTNDPADKVATFYEEAFKKSGWTIGGRLDMGSSIAFQANKGLLSCGVSINQAEGLTLIVMGMVMDEKTPEGKEDDPREKTPKMKTPSVGGADLPKDFPGDVPLYAGAKVTAANTFEGIHTATFVTFDKAEKVAAYYATAAKKLEWNQISKTQEGDSTAFIFAKVDRILAVRLDQDEGETLIQVIVAKDTKK